MVYRGHVKNRQILLDDQTRLPEGAEVTVQVRAGTRRTSSRGLSRQQILQMPVEERRELLMKQSERLARHYEADPDRADWQGGDIVE